MADATSTQQFTAPTGVGGRGVPGPDRLLTPQQIAEAWQLDTSTIRKIFQDIPGVLKLSNGNVRKKRSYCTLRIPLTVVERVFQERSR